MFARFDILFLLAVVVAVSLLVLAIALVARPASRAKSFWLLIYAVTLLNSLYGTAMVKIDKGLGRGGEFWHRVTLPPDVNFVLDVLGRIGLLIGIWLFLIYLVRTRIRRDGTSVTVRNDVAG